MSNYNFIIIEGNIGSGKTTLASKLANDNNSRLILEQFADNPFLPKFYKEPDKYAFPLELSFLAERYHQLKSELTKHDLFQPSIVSDYYFLKSLIFAKANLPEDEFELYSKLFYIIYDSLPKPELFVFLYCDVKKLQENIRKRGRNYEQNIPDEYLLKIQNSYLDFLKQLSDLRIVMIDVNNLDYSANETDYLIVKDLLAKKYPLGITRIFGE
jgi:deoxyadenosine/deoxycytidine kinase